MKKALTVMAEDNKNRPEGWKIAAIEDIAVVNPRINKSHIDDNLNVSFVPMPAVGAANGIIDVTQKRPFSEVKKGYTGFLAGDVLFAKITPCMENGKMAIVPKLINGYGFGSTEFHVLRPKQGIDGRYLYYFVSSEVFRKNAAHHMTGAVGQKRVPTGYIKKSKFPIAPLNEQKRIVAEIEKQFSRLDEAVENLKRIKANLKRYKASVLKAAVEGKLTEEWRKKNLPAPSSKPGKFYTYAILCDNDSIYIGHTDDIERRWKQHIEGKGAEWTKKHKPVKIVHYEEFDTRKEAADREKWLKTGYGRKWLKREYAAGRTRQAGQVEPADKLLERILAERRKKWEEAELARLRERIARRQAKMKNKGKVPKDDKWKKKYKEPQIPPEFYLDLPDSWIEVRAEQICDFITKGTTPKATKLYSDKGEIPFIKVYNLTNMGRLDFSIKPTFISKNTNENELARSRVYPGDVLMNIVGPPLGKVSLIPRSFGEGNINQAISIFRTMPSYNNLLFSYFLLSDTILSWAIKLAKATAGQFNLTLEICRNLPIPVPPLEEQNFLVLKIERIVSGANVIEKEIDSNLSRTERLRQSILKKAFSGKLLE